MGFRPTFLNVRRLARDVAVALPVFCSSACSDLLQVEDPQRYTSEDLDQTLEQVADGVEGTFHRGIQWFVIGTALLGDEFQGSGWYNWNAIGRGDFEYRDVSTNLWGNMDGGPFVLFLQARWFAGDTRERLERVLGDTARTSPLMAQVDVIEGLADLYLAQGFCEAPAVPDGPAISDIGLLEQAVSKLDRAIESSAASNSDKWRLVALAGRARAHLLLGDYDAALADAEAVLQAAPEFAYRAMYSGADPSTRNHVVYYATHGFNSNATVRAKWWDRVEPSTHLLLDPQTGEPDPRVPIFYDGHSVAVDGVTPHYSQWKYQDLGDDIPVLDAQEMRLIEAEVHWERGDLGAALSILNALRADAGLSPLPDTQDKQEVLEFLLHERFAEMFMEGQRMTDLHRFNLVKDMILRGDFGDTEPERPSKFPLLEEEALYNPNIENDPALRCLPMSG